VNNFDTSGDDWEGGMTGLVPRASHWSSSIRALSSWGTRVRWRDRWWARNERLGWVKSVPKSRKQARAGECSVDDVREERNKTKRNKTGRLLEPRNRTQTRFN